MPLPPLSAANFPAYFQAVHGVTPFPWQCRLLAEVLERGWTRPISIPTASGKTAVLDVAVFALACQADRSEARTAPRRIALVVDRRIVVDGAFARARRIRDRILAHPELAAVRERLAALGGEEPLAVALMRGGIYREDRWARSPAQPVILCSTVDQVGSRLLFRGYGLSNHAWPIHAGLLGNDTLIVLDEAHCSRPFLETTQWISRYRSVAERPLPAPFAAVAMTATIDSAVEPFRLDAADHADPILRQRLAAKKPIILLDPCGKNDADLAAAAATAVIAQIQTRPGATVLAVVNRVAAARALRQLLATRTKAAKEPLAADVIMLTGRSRSVQRDSLIEHWKDRLMAGRNRSATAGAKALVVVATQCVEVGADLDVDALISECCPLDALRQRLGRLDRLGRLLAESGGQPPQAVIICRKDQAWNGDGDPADDPIYGQALARTWHWLTTHGAGLDGGIDGLTAILPPTIEAAALNAPAVQAPIIFPAYCDLWSQTGPEPAISPEPAIFLHGPRQGEPEVQIVWRTDLDPASANLESVWRDTIALCPPVSGEGLSLPLSMARRWLSGALAKDESLADADAAAGENPDEGTFHPALRWRGPDASALATRWEDLRPGDVLVVPTGYGGCDEFGWHPGAIPGEAVTDLADQARQVARRAPVRRIHPSIPGLSPTAAELATIRTELDPGDLESRLDLALASDPSLKILGADPELAPHPSGLGFVLIGSAGWSEDAQDFTDEDDSSSRAPRRLPLEQHLADVETIARRFAQALGLPEPLGRDLALAGKLHDLGKADPRFQAWLCGGDGIKARRFGLLAKSPRLLTGNAMRQARGRSGYPQGGRHELLSVRLAESTEAILVTAIDRELVLHLIASHHGRCRPWAPVVRDDHPQPVSMTLDGLTMTAPSATGLERLDSGVAERFWTLTRRYGWWGLAWLEACLRLADHRASESAEKGESP